MARNPIETVKVQIINVQDCRYGSPCITFDQPLWLKALEITVAAIGSLMGSSGLSDIMQTLYGENTVKHIMTGKAIARAIRSHI